MNKRSALNKLADAVGPQNKAVPYATEVAPTPNAFVPVNPQPMGDTQSTGPITASASPEYSNQVVQTGAASGGSSTSALSNTRTVLHLSNKNKTKDMSQPMSPPQQFTGFRDAPPAGGKTNWKTVLGYYQGSSIPNVKWDKDLLKGPAEPYKG